MKDISKKVWLHLSAIPRLQKLASDHLTPARSGNGAVSAERSIGINVAALDYSMAKETLEILHGWESMIREARQLTPPALVKAEATTEAEVRQPRRHIEIEHLVGAGRVSVERGRAEVGAHSESDLLKPSNPYSATKAAADHLVTSYGRTYGVPYIILRPTNNYGIGQYVEKLIPKSVKYLSLGRCIDIHQNGTPRRTWLHVSDTANAVLTVIDAGVKNEIYNISGNHECANIEVINKIVTQIKGTSNNIEQYLEHMTRPGQDVRYAIDDTKLQTLGWRATALFDNELTNIVKYYQDNFVW